MVLVAATACPIRGGRAQDADEPRFVSWSKVENADATREYKDKLKEAGAFDQASRTFLVQDALPQLAREENRGSIERVRRRMREVLLTEVGNPQVLVAANETVAEFMEGLARDKAADPVVRVNAAIMIGELRTADGRSWTGGVPRIVGLATDPQMIAGVRVAAVAGLSRSGAAVASDPKTAAAVGQAAMSILAESAGKAGGEAGPSRPEQDWLASRAVLLLPAIVTEHPKGVADQILKLVADESRSIDLRVRAAAAVAAKAGANSGVDVGQLVPVIEGMAVKMLADDLATADRGRFELEYRRFVGGKGASGQGGPEPPAVGELQLVPEQVARREAWRLVTLASALEALAQGPAADRAKTLSSTLREAGMAIDADPTEQAIRGSLEKLRPSTKKSKPGGDVAPSVRPGGQEAPADGNPPDPFPGPAPGGEPAPEPGPSESSPFG